MSAFDEEERKLYEDLIKAIVDNNSEEINRLKYECLFYGSNLLDVVINYITLSKNGIDFDFGCRIIKKGTKLYRIRRFEQNIDFNSEQQWSYPPKMPENRANRSGEPALYLGTEESVCILETHIAKDEMYALGEYEVVEDIKLGGFLECEDYKKKTRYLAGVILNAFLIAPSRGEKNKELFAYLDEHYYGLTINDIKIKDADKIDLPLKFGVINKKEEFYKITNRLIDSIKGKYKEGINYSSCYIPVATVGIMCSASNIVLYEKGMKKLRFVRSEIKKCDKNLSCIDVLKILSDISEKRA